MASGLHERAPHRPMRLGAPGPGAGHTRDRQRASIVNASIVVAAIVIVGQLWALAVATVALERGHSSTGSHVVTFVAFEALSFAAALGILTWARKVSIRDYVRSAPRRSLPVHASTTVARHVRMVSSLSGKSDVGLEAEPAPKVGSWTVHVCVADRSGLLAAIAGVFLMYRVSVVDAQISTTDSGVAVDVFRVQAPQATDWNGVRESLEEALTRREAVPSPEPVEGLVEIDNLASPRYTIIEVLAKDRSGLLYRVALAFARARVQVHEATVTTLGDVAVDTFWVTDRSGGKIDRTAERDVRAALAGGVPRRRPVLRGWDSNPQPTD